jgi:hypothetical protein
MSWHGPWRKQSNSYSGGCPSQASKASRRNLHRRPILLNHLVHKSPGCACVSPKFSGGLDGRSVPISFDHARSSPTRIERYREFIAGLAAERLGAKLPLTGYDRLLLAVAISFPPSGRLFCVSTVSFVRPVKLPVPVRAADGLDPPHDHCRRR